METTLAELVCDVADVEVDGVMAEELSPTETCRSYTCDEIAREAGISPASPKYSGLHQHCQYSRTC